MNLEQPVQALLSPGQLAGQAEGPAAVLQRHLCEVMLHGQTQASLLLLTQAPLLVASTQVHLLPARA